MSREPQPTDSHEMDSQAMQEAARQRTAELEVLREVGLDLSSKLDLDNLLGAVVSQAMTLLGASGGGLYLYRAKQDLLEWVVGVGPGAPVVGTTLRRGEGLSGVVWETGESLVVDDYQHWRDQAAVYKGRPTVAVIGVPVRWGREMLGVINVGAPPPRKFSPADVELLGLFATQAAIAIRNAQLFQIVEQGKRDWEATFDTMQDVIVLLDLDRRVLRANRAFADLVQTAFPEIVGQGYDALLEGTTCPETTCPLEAALAAGRPAACVHGFRGRVFEVEATPVAVHDPAVGGDTAHTIIVMHDITERKRREEEREKLVRELQEALAEVKTLSGLLPICANCKKIRDDQGYWHAVEVYVREHSDADFSHGMCPDCMKALYPWFERSRASDST